MPHLAVRLLGGFQVELDGEAVYAFKTDKARALLAYLVVESARPHRRETSPLCFGPTGRRRSPRQSAPGAFVPPAGAARRLAVAVARTRAAGSGPPALPSGHPHRRAVHAASDHRSMRPSSRHSRPHRCAATTAAPRPTAVAAGQLLPEAFCADFWRGCRCPTARRSRPGRWTGRSTTTGSPSTSSTSRSRPSRGWGITSRPRPRRRRQLRLQALAGRGASALHAGAGPGRASGRGAAPV